MGYPPKKPADMRCPPKKLVGRGQLEELPAIEGLIEEPPATGRLHRVAESQKDSTKLPAIDGSSGELLAAEGTLIAERPSVELSADDNTRDYLRSHQPQKNSTELPVTEGLHKAASYRRIIWRDTSNRGTTNCRKIFSL